MDTGSHTWSDIADLSSGSMVGSDLLSNHIVSTGLRSGRTMALAQVSQTRLQVCRALGLWQALALVLGPCMKHEEVWGRTRRSSEVGGVTVTRFDDDRTGSIWKSPLQKQVFKVYSVQDTL